MSRTFVGGSIWVFDLEDERRATFSDHPSFLAWVASRPGVVVLCHTCGAEPIGTYQDGSWRYDCHLKSGIPHGPTARPTPLWLPEEEIA